jgi:hypothetical protein
MNRYSQVIGLFVLAFLTLGIARIEAQQDMTLTQSEQRYKDLYAQKQFDAALPYALRAAHLATSDATVSDSRRIDLLNGVAELYFLLGNYSRAEVHTREVLTRRQRASQQDDDAIAVSEEELAKFLDVQGKVKEAAALHAEARTRHEMARSVSAQEQSEHSHYELEWLYGQVKQDRQRAEVAYGRGDYIEAEAAMRGILNLLGAAREQNADATAVTQEDLAELLDLQGKAGEAAVLHALARAQLDLTPGVSAQERSHHQQQQLQEYPQQPPPSSAVGREETDVTGSVYDFFDPQNPEERGFGRYTYVLGRTCNPRCIKLIAALIENTPSGALEAANRAVLNVFEIPVSSGRRDQIRYDDRNLAGAPGVSESADGGATSRAVQIAAVYDIPNCPRPLVASLHRIPYGYGQGLYERGRAGTVSCNLCAAREVVQDVTKTVSDYRSKRRTREGLSLLRCGREAASNDQGYSRSA